MTRAKRHKIPVALDQNFFPVRRYGRDRKMRIIRAKRLLKQFDLQIDHTLIFKNAEALMLNGCRMLVFDLDEGCAVDRVVVARQ